MYIQNQFTFEAMGPDPQITREICEFSSAAAPRGEHIYYIYEMHFIAYTYIYVYIDMYT